MKFRFPKMLLVEVTAGTTPERVEVYLMRVTAAIASALSVRKVAVVTIVVTPAEIAAAVIAAAI